MSIKIEKTEVVGWEPAIRGMRNPKNSWDREDSCYCEPGDNCCTCAIAPDPDDDSEDNGALCGSTPAGYFVIGPNDHGLMMNLAAGGPVHAKYRRMITVYVDITAPLYWWKEFDTYKVGTVANSCSTMHKLTYKEFELDDFSHEHLIDNAYEIDPLDIDGYVYFPKEILIHTIEALNQLRHMYLKAKTKPMKEESKRAELMKKIWEQMIQLLPSSYNQKRTIMLNYEVLAGIYPMRKGHKLDEWHVFCDWIESLPYSEIITGVREAEDEPSDAEEYFKKYGGCNGCKHIETEGPCLECIRVYGNDQNPKATDKFEEVEGE